MNNSLSLGSRGGTCQNHWTIGLLGYAVFSCQPARETLLYGQPTGPNPLTIVMISWTGLAPATHGGSPNLSGHDETVSDRERQRKGARERETDACAPLQGYLAHRKLTFPRTLQ